MNGLPPHNESWTIGKIYKSNDNGSGFIGDDGYKYNDLRYNEFDAVKFKEIIQPKTDIKGKKIAVLCDTKEKVEKFYEIINHKVNRDIFKCDYPKRLYIGFDIGGNLTWDSHDYFQRNNYELITFDEFMNGKFKVEVEKEEENKEMGNKFKVGDIVKGNKLSGKEYGITDERVLKAKVIKAHKDGRIDIKILKYKGNIYEEGEVYTYLKESCFDFLSETKQSPSKTLTITTSDTITTLTDGQHTTSINRYYTDKNDEKVAVNEVVKKYYAELDEIERVSRMPKVGDEVKVVDSGRTFSNYDTWLIKNKIDIKYAIKWHSGTSTKNGNKYTVVAIYKHLDFKDTLALIEDNCGCYIINIEGLEVVK